MPTRGSGRSRDRPNLGSGRSRDRPFHGSGRSRYRPNLGSGRSRDRLGTAAAKEREPRVVTTRGSQEERNDEESDQPISSIRRLSAIESFTSVS
jgi:hypothetical protein